MTTQREIIVKIEGRAFSKEEIETIIKQISAIESVNVVEKFNELNKEFEDEPIEYVKCTTTGPFPSFFPCHTNNETPTFLEKVALFIKGLFK